MADLEGLRHAIDTATDLHSVVRTMKSLSMASIHQYEQAMQSLTDYTRNVELGLSVVLRDLPLQPEERPRPSEPGSAVAVVFGSDRGLCGRFNEDLTDFLLERLNGMHIRQEDRQYLTVGTRIDAHLDSHHQARRELFSVPASVMAISETVQRLVLRVEHFYRTLGADRVVLFYNRNLARQSGREPTELRLLPLDSRRLRGLTDEPWPGPTLPGYREPRSGLLAALTRQMIFGFLFRACAESLASEHASRLAAMEVADRNIAEHLQELAQRFRHQRQEIITEELLDLIAGFEALEGEEQRPG